MSEHVLAIDQGTTGTTVMVFDGHGRIRARAYNEIRQFYPRPGWVEHDAEEIYRSALELSRQALAQAHMQAGDLATIGITNQRETFVVWQRGNGRPIHRAIVWQCRRSTEICASLREREGEISARTGLIADPYFSGTKLKWLLDSERGLRRRAANGELCFGTIESWLIYRLSRGAAFVSDFTNASRTMLLNLESLSWDPRMLEMLEVPERMLPALVPSRAPQAEAASGTIGDHAVPICASIGDQQSALFGQGVTRPGEAKVTYGTGAFLLTPVNKDAKGSSSRLLRTSALGAKGQPIVALEGSVFIAGAAVQWLRDQLGLIANAAATTALARQSRDRTHPYVVPAFVGLGAPYWDPDARGAIVGLTRGTSRADLVRATLDSIAYQVLDVVTAMESETGRRIRELRVDGGAAANNYLMQFQADILGRRIRRPKMAETTVLGAAMLAGLSAGVWGSDDELAHLRKTDRVFEPRMAAHERALLVAGWKAAVGRVLTK
ncbi:MAG: glycerol kinase GlpK [Candidatus Binataceae bacterium]